MADRRPSRFSLFYLAFMAAAAEVAAILMLTSTDDQGDGWLGVVRVGGLGLAAVLFLAVAVGAGGTRAAWHQPVVLAAMGLVAVVLVATPSSFPLVLFGALGIVLGFLFLGELRRTSRR